MPTYEYICDACGHEFERFQKMNDSPVRKCPECGRPKARRRISTGGGIVFKGPGFYATDYREPAPGEAKKPKSETGKSDDSSSKSGGDSGDG